MAIPEIEPRPQQPQPEVVQQIPEQAEIPAHVEQATGVQAVPAQPQPLQQNGQVVAQPVPPPQDDNNMPTIVVPADSEEQLEKLAQGDPEDASTWWGVAWLYIIKQKLHDGVRAVFSRNNNQQQ